MERWHSPEEVGKAISNGHGFKHVERGEFAADEQRGPDTGVSTREEYALHIVETMVAGDTVAFKTQHNHEIYYNNRTNTFVAYDPTREDLGTCFRPTSLKDKFEKEFQKDIIHGGSSDRSRIIEGGYYALHPEHVKERQGNQAGQTAGKVLHVAADIVGKAVEKLADFVAGLFESLMGAPPRTISVTERLTDPAAAAEYRLQQRTQRERNEALDRIAEDIKRGKNLDRNDVRKLGLDDLEGIRAHGDAHVEKLVREREEERKRERLRSQGRDRGR